MFSTSSCRQRSKENIFAAKLQPNRRAIPPSSSLLPLGTSVAVRGGSDNLEHRVAEKLGSGLVAWLPLRVRSQNVSEVTNYEVDEVIMSTRACQMPPSKHQPQPLLSNPIINVVPVGPITDYKSTKQTSSWTHFASRESTRTLG